MNKEKEIFEAIQKKAWGVNRTTRRVYGQGQYDMAYEILNMVKEIIQTEKKDKTNFDVITESPEKLAESLLEYANYVENGLDWACDLTVEDTLKWLNQKAEEE